MVFSSLEFIFRFLPVFLVLYTITPSKFKNFTLFAGSLVFYAFGEPRYILLILLSIAVNFWLGRKIELRRRRKARQKQEEKRRQKPYLFLTVLFNIGVLLFFKYSNFFIENMNAVFLMLADSPEKAYQWKLLKVTLPLGISFYTFQIVSYVLDVYHGKVKAERSVLTLGTYLCMFPQLIAGPIVIYSDVEKALYGRPYSAANIEDGLRTFVIGLASKVLIANRIGTLWTEIQTIGFASISMPLAWLGALAFSFQIYFDFFGYSLMAIGLGKMLGFNLPQNFNLPYMATSVTDFWRRWHMTLSGWFREYIYIPLGGNRKGKLRTMLNLLTVWSLTGFWHGASWNFILWGFTMFVFLTVERLFLKKWLDKCSFIGHLYMFLFIPVTWMLFAITDMKELGIYFERLFSLSVIIKSGNVGQNDIANALHTYGGLFGVSLLFSTPLPGKLYQRFHGHFITSVILFVLFWLSIYQLAIAVNNPFLYFRF